MSAERCAKENTTDPEHPQAQAQSGEFRCVERQRTPCVPTYAVIRDRRGFHRGGRTAGISSNSQSSPFPSSVHVTLWHSVRPAIEYDFSSFSSANGVRPFYYVPLPVVEGYFVVQELDGHFVMRSIRNIMERCQPGSWQHTIDGQPFFVRSQPYSLVP